MSYIKPEDVPRDKERKVLDFLNAAKTSEEIAATIEFPGERDVGIKIAQRILKERDILGGFTSLKQIDDIKQIGPERFAEIVSALVMRKGEGVRRRELVDYIIRGKIDPEDLKKVSKEVPIEVYAARDRRVLGSAPVNEDGSFEIRYEYKASGKDKKPIGAYFIIGPKLPGDQILKTKLERRFLNSKGFKKASPEFMYEFEKKISLGPVWLKKYDSAIIKVLFTYKGIIRTCSPLHEDIACPFGCENMGSLSTSENRVYVRISRGDTVIGNDIEVSDGSDGALTGEFSITKSWYWLLHPISPIEIPLVEIYQKIGGITNTLYSDYHEFENNLPVYFCIDRDDVEIIEIPEPEGPGTDDSFGFTQVGNIPIDYINQSTGYPDSSTATDSATHKVKDFAFCGNLHLYANIGEDLLIDTSTGDCKIQYIRVKYEHLDTGTEGYIQVPFGNAREPREGEGDDLITETMGPLPPSDTGGIVGVYRYANPYETVMSYPREINDWVFKGLLMVIQPSSLPFNYGKYRLSVEAYDADMDFVAIADEADNDYAEEFVLIIDNDTSALTGYIEDIMGTGACGFLDRTSIGSGIPFDIEVEFDIEDSRGNLRDFKLVAHWGAGDLEILSDGEYPTYSGIIPPYWYGESGITATGNKAWVQCAYQFRLSARRKVTNGFSNQWWREIYNKHITILSNNSYA